MNQLQAADVTPTANQREAIHAALQTARPVLARWASLRTEPLGVLNEQLRAAGLEAIRTQ